MANYHLHSESRKSELGKKVLNLLITNSNRKKLGRYLKERARLRMIKAVTGEHESHLDDILRNVLKHLSPITQPPVLISQVQHGGGALLNRLFDGHPEINALPQEIGGGTAEADRWPGIDLTDRPQDWFEILFEEVDTTLIQKKIGGGEADSRTTPFVFLPLIQEQLFLKQLETRDSLQQRDVIDAYITSCFGAWLDYQNLSDVKKYTTACAPDLAARPESLEAFFDMYPEGRLISLVRKPEDWLACARTCETDTYENARSAVNLWKKSVRVMLAINRKFGDRVRLVRFEDLNGRTEAVMRFLADFLEISFNDVLLKPTFNSMPFQNSDGRQADISDALRAYACDPAVLAEDHLKMTADVAHDDYETILQEVVVF